MRSGGLFVRLAVVLALVLFGLPQNSAAGLPGSADPAAQFDGGQSEGILTVQRHLVRALVGDEPSADMVEPRSVAVVRPALIAVGLSPDQHQAQFVGKIAFLPQGRAPPEV